MTALTASSGESASVNPRTRRPAPASSAFFAHAAGSSITSPQGSFSSVDQSSGLRDLISIPTTGWFGVGASKCR
ncbi:MAG: hypothetical protein M5U11_11770 [Anaerolineales bacterium]|nr:hypothetical protein [Anaerolineales bacterium]